MIGSVGGGNLGATTIDDKLFSLVPAWSGSVGRFENDALVSETMFPSVDIGYDGHNKKSTLLGLCSARTRSPTPRSHDVGSGAHRAARPLPRRSPRSSRPSTQVEQTIGMDLDEVFGWWGDVARRRLAGRRRYARRRRAHRPDRPGGRESTVTDIVRGLLVARRRQARVSRFATSSTATRRSPSSTSAAAAGADGRRAAARLQGGDRLHGHRRRRRHRLRAGVRRERPRRRARSVARRRRARERRSSSASARRTSASRSLDVRRDSRARRSRCSARRCPPRSGRSTKRRSGRSCCRSTRSRRRVREDGDVNRVPSVITVTKP